jgi:NitT/TauT family transport system substrate-binding protein
MPQRLLTPLLVLALASVLGAARAAAAQPDKAVLMLNWYVYGEHAPFFLGLARGYYAKENIDLEIQEGRGSGITVQAVGAGSATFGYADIGTMIKAASKGAPVESAGILLQTSPMSVMCFASEHIDKPADLVGKTVAVTPGDSLSQVWPVFLKVNGIEKSQINEVAGDAITKRNAVVNGQADCLLGNMNDQAPIIEETTGKPMHAVLFAGYGVNLINAGIVVSKDLIKSKPALVKRFMKASTAAVEAAVKAPEEAVDDMLKVNPKAGNRDTLLKSFKLTIPLYHTKATEAQPPFRVAAKDMESTLDMLEKYGGVDAASAGKAADYYTLQFLP